MIITYLVSLLAEMIATSRRGGLKKGRKKNTDCYKMAGPLMLVPNNFADEPTQDERGVHVHCAWRPRVRCPIHVQERLT